MGNIISEGLEHIGDIDNSGYVSDKCGNCVAKINDNGYICELGKNNILGKIDEDGTIRDSSLNAIGRVQADGYVNIHSKRVCRVSSTFVERITPKAWNAGEYSSFSGRKSSTAYQPSSYSSEDTSGGTNFFFSAFFIKLIIGIIIGIVAWINGIGGIGNLIAGPVFVHGRK